jgi:hypothetical protein
MASDDCAVELFLEAAQRCGREIRIQDAISIEKQNVLNRGPAPKRFGESLVAAPSSREWPRRVELYDWNSHCLRNIAASVA